MVKPTTVETQIQKFLKDWKEWKDLAAWAKRTKKPESEWRKLLSDYINEVFKNLKEKNEKAYLGLSTKEISDICYECKRRIYQKHYIDMMKPAGSRAKSDEFYIFVYQNSGYFDWAGPKRQEALERWTNADKSTQDLMLQKKEFKISRNSAGKMEGIEPLMNWGKGKRPIPTQAYMGTCWGAAIPVQAFERWLKEGDDSDALDELMPFEMDLSSVTDRAIHYGDPTSDKYLDLKPFHRYRGTFVHKRGKKVKLDDNTQFYQFEGKVETKDVPVEGGEEGETRQVTYYSGQRSFMYNLAPSQNVDLKEAPEFDFEGFEDYIMNDVVYETFKSQLNITITEEQMKELTEDEIEEAQKMSGMPQIPDFFRYYNSKNKTRTEALHPVAFEADVLDTFESEIDEDNDPDAKKFYKIRLNVQELELLDETENFTDLTLSMFPDTPDFEELFGQLAPNTRVKVVCTLFTKNDEDPITGNCLWFEPIQSSALDKSVFTDDIFGIEEDDQNVLEPDEDKADID